MLRSPYNLCLGLANLIWFNLSSNFLHIKAGTQEVIIKTLIVVEQIKYCKNHGIATIQIHAEYINTITLLC